MLKKILESHNYALIDRGRFNSLPDGLHGAALQPSALAGQAEELPVLAPIGEIPTPRLAELFEQSNRDRLCGRPALFETFIYSEVPESGLRRHLTEQLILNHAQSRYLLRYYDPRVFTQLWWILGANKMRLLMGGICQPFITRWTIYIDKRWQTLTPPEPAGLGVPSTALHLDWLGYVNAALRELAPFASLDERVEMGKKAFALLERGARKYGLENKKDLLLFAHYGLRKHFLFDEHQALEPLWARVQKGVPFGPAMQKLSLDWNAVCFDLEKRR